MSTAPPHPLRRRLIWSVAATLCLVFVSSTTQSTIHQPTRSFSLGLDRALGAGLELDLGFLSPETPAPPADATGAGFILDAPGAWHLRPAKGTAGLDDYVRSLPFGREIDDAAQRHEIDVLLLASVVEAESSFRADAISPKGALGLMQLMPLHFEGTDQPFDPERNLELGARYLGSLRQRYDGDLELALAAYHAGPGTVERFGGAPPWRETRLYVDKVLMLYREHQAQLAGESTAL